MTEAAGEREALQRAMESGDPDDGPKAAVELGKLLHGNGDLEGAKAAWQRAIDSGHPEAAPEAEVILGNTMMSAGDVAGAKAAYQHVLQTGHPEYAPRAATNLGVALAQLGDSEGAKSAYQQAIAGGNAMQAARARRQLDELTRHGGSQPDSPDGADGDLRPWWKKKRFLLPAGAVALLLIISAGNNDNASKQKEAAKAPATPVSPTTTSTVPAMLPNPVLTPGSVFPDGTIEKVCAPGYASSVRAVDEATRQMVFAAYRIDYSRHASFELDHLVPLELGGDNSPLNLWPEPQS